MLHEKHEDRKMAKRQMSEPARAAKMIRSHLKKNGIKASVRSKQFSMGDSVSIHVADVLPATRRAIEEYCSQFQYGHFDGMVDMYEYSNKRSDIPQSKFVSVSVDYSDELRQAAWDYIRGYYADFADAPADLKSANRFYAPKMGESGSMMIWQVLGGSRGCRFWSNRKPRIAA